MKGVLAAILLYLFPLTEGFSREQFARTINRQKNFHSEDYLPFVKQYSRAWLDGLIPTAVGNVSEQCKLDSIVYRDALATARSPWALQMFDATGKLPDGILNGNWHALGDYEQCLRVRPDTTEGSWRGKYCQVFIAIINPPDRMFNMWFFQLAASGAPLDPGEQSVNSVQQPSFGVCLPSSCSAEDITVAITGMSTGNTSINGALGFTGTTRESYCSVDADEPVQLDDGAIAMLTVLGILGFCIISGTLLDFANECKILKKNDGLFFRIFLCFSILTNGSKLLSTKSGVENLSCLHGLRFISFTWVLVGHAYSWTMFPTANYLGLGYQMVNSVAFQAVSNSYLAVDSFFFMTGLLLAYLFLKAMKKTGTKWGITPQVNPIMLTIHRFLRLTPPCALILGVYVNLWPLISDGPAWHNVENFANRCRAQWWGNLLYIQNLVFEFVECMEVTWYLAVEFQIFVPATLFVVLMYRYERVGVAITVILTLLGGILGAVYTAIWDMPPTFFVLGSVNSQFDGYIDYYMTYYEAFWFRYPPFFVGMLVGWALYKVKQPGFTKPKWLKPGIARLLALVGWLVAGASGAGVLYGLYDYIDGSTLMPQEVQIFYGGFHKTIWAVCLGWLVFACDMGYGGPINTFLSWKLFMVLGRLTFCAYLIHLDWIIFYLSYARAPMYYTTLNMAYVLIGHVVVTLLLATIATLAFEAPFLNLEKMLFEPPKPKKLPQSNMGDPKRSLPDSTSADIIEEEMKIPPASFTSNGADN